MEHARAQGRGAGSRPKLSNEQAQAAKELIDGDKSVSVVARTFNVSRPTIYRAIERMDTQTQR
ncbi:helix-turn-helix domain-containing protein [Corynebacterium urealyticum]|uniref:helix-turn-helix domain-containing protein n=1 Tax=Corynebacterium urealyticum TaxID=43771 RepID=UPI001F4219E8|nr:helix-turn-helix domain-containing protein [Corynebacterium urealyticum]